MAIRATIQYYDDEAQSMGFLLGSDNNAGYNIVGDRSMLSFPFGLIAAFEGGTTAGILQGAANKEDSEQFLSFLKDTKDLESMFGDITTGRDYSDSPVIAGLDSYTMMVAQNDGSRLHLYTVSNIRETEKNVAHCLSSVEPGMYKSGENTMVFYAPGTKEILTFEIKGRMDKIKAIKTMQQLLMPPQGLLDVLGKDQPQPENLSHVRMAYGSSIQAQPDRLNMVYLSLQGSGTIPFQVI